MDYFQINKLSYSTLKNIFRSYEYFLYQLTCKFESSLPMQLGNMVHSFILEGKEENPLEKMDVVGKRGAITSTGQQAVDAYYGMIDTKPLYDFTNCEIEKRLFWNYDGVDFKSRVDAYNPDTKTLIDLKTDRAWGDFDYTFFRMKYDMQLYMYTLALQANGYEVENYIIYTVNSTPPYEHCLHRIDPLCVLYGRRNFEKALELFHNQGAGEQESRLDLPTYKLKELEAYGILHEEE